MPQTHLSETLPNKKRHVMEITEPLLKERFRALNREIFDGQLRMPTQMRVKKMTHAAGQAWRKGKGKSMRTSIYISSCFDFTPTTFDEVIIVRQAIAPPCRWHLSHCALNIPNNPPPNLHCFCRRTTTRLQIRHSCEFLQMTNIQSLTI